jgi:RNA ligase
MLISDVLQYVDLEAMIKAKYVKEQVHPQYPQLRILNYTDSCTWDRAWNEVTLQCRGLIYDAHTLQVVARPLRKFFNREQEEAPQFLLTDTLHVTDKVDGSLGILYRQPDTRWSIATRGSFASEQALWATGHYRKNYESEWEPNPDWTYLYEILYPDNRIVVDYEGWEALVLLGAVDKATGRSIPIEIAQGGWPGPKVHLVHRGMALADILAIPPRANAEGFVLWQSDTDQRVKIKYDEYKMLHRFLTNTSEKNVWEVLSSGPGTYDSVKEAFAAAPDEFHDWLRWVAQGLMDAYGEILFGATLYHETLVKELPEGYTRKDFALLAKEQVPPPYLAMMFLLEDGRDDSLRETIWKLIRPVGSTTFRKVNSDAD